MGTLYNATGNVRVSHPATGQYLLTFTGALALADLSSTASALTLCNGPGFVSYASGGTGKLLARTSGTGRAPTNRGFRFVIFQP